jgi:hypothetical protein
MGVTLPDRAAYASNPGGREADVTDAAGQVEQVGRPSQPYLPLTEELPR